MKKSIFTIAFAIASVFVLISSLEANAQLKVYSDGKMSVASTSTTTPSCSLYVNGTTGIGTATPTAALEVAIGNILINKTSAHNQLGVTRSTNAYGASLNLNTSATNDWIIGERGVTSSDFRIYSYGTSSDVFLIQRSNGNVGIGTTGPNYQLELSNNSAAKPTSSTWTVPSDERVKKDIAPFADGLNVIRAINPVKYKYNGLARTPNNDEGIGIIAQEIQKIAPYTVKPVKMKLEPAEVSAFPGEISTVTVALDSANTAQITQGTILSFDAHPLFFLLINSVKELDSTLAAVQNQLNSLTGGGLRKNTSTQSKEETTLQVELANNKEVILYQNEPNPFDGSTVIRYFIPENSTGNAYVAFYDMYGKEINKLELKERGFGKIEANTENLANGIYSYSIVVNDKIIDTKRMVRTQ